MDEIKKVELFEEVKPIKKEVYEIGGKTFNTLRKAQYYLREILYKELFKTIPQVESELFYFDVDKQTWYYCESFNHLLAVFGYNQVNDYNKFGIDDIKFPQWIYVYTSDWGDSGSCASWTTLDELIMGTYLNLEFINKLNNR